MSASNGVIRIGRKGIKKFAFGDDGAPFEVDVIVAFQEWIATDEQFRADKADAQIATADMHTYHHAAVEFVKKLSGTEITTAEALDFIARLREQYDEMADFFQPRSRAKPDSPGTSAAELRFSEEPAARN